MTTTSSNAVTGTGPGESGWALAWRMARREIRGSVARFRVFLGALMLGVAAIGTVGSVAEAMRDGIAGNARLLLGGDVELRSLYMPTPDPVLATAQEYGTLSRTMTMRAMLQAGDERRLVALKAVDEAWPMVGAAKRLAAAARWRPPLPTARSLSTRSWHGASGWQPDRKSGSAMPSLRSATRLNTNRTARSVS